MQSSTAELAPVHIPQERLDELSDRLRRSELADDFGNADWRYGVERGYLAELVAYWRDEFDWRAQEAAMNRYRHYRVRIDDIPIHFLHVRGSGPRPLPLILTHGWPWTFWDFAKVIGPLADPEAHGGDPRDAFDVVVPSLPGYAFSTPLERTGVTPAVVAELWVALMCDVLGYRRFAAHGGDWGLRVNTVLGSAHADRLLGLHLSGAPLAALTTDRPWSDAFSVIYTRSPAPRQALVAWEATRAAHVAVHGLDPQTLAYALQDSPAGLCAWLLERRRAWSDCGGVVESVFSKDELLTAATLYWATASVASSLRLYWEAMRAAPLRAHDSSRLVETPTAVSLFTPDAPPGLDWSHLPESFNIRQLREHDRGGHFAAVENPQAIIGDLRDFFRPLRLRGREL